MKIERDTELRIHKSLAIRGLEGRIDDVTPEQFLAEAFPDYEGTVEELLEELRNDPRQTFVNGELQ